MLKNKKRNTRITESAQGITLVALVVTIVVLIILATISISIIFDNDGIMERARSTQAHQANADKQWEEINANVVEYIDSAVGGTGTTNPQEPTTIGPNGKPLLTTLTSIQEKTIKAEDRLGNPITIPGGFKVVEGELVQDGIVIEDSNVTTNTKEDGTTITMGNQFVWVPVSNIDGGTDTTKNKLIKIEDDTTKEVTEVEITLGRYSTFSKTAEPVQLGSAYADGANDTYRIANSANNGYMKELNTARDGVASTGTDGENATYQTLGAFVESVRDNNGYYIARYEASYESGEGTDYSTYKMASKKSTSVSQSTSNDWKNTSGRLWHWITQINASKVARNMYNTNDEESEYVVSDLINSYMWDTALMYITKVEDDSYHDDTDGNGTLYNAGATTDIKCNIYDMKGNLREWTTENSTISGSSDPHPYTSRGGDFINSNGYTSKRYYNIATTSSYTIGFRAALYCTPES